MDMVFANVFGPDGVFLILVILAVLIFGSQAPKIARNIGLAGREFKKAQQEADEEHAREQAAKAVTPPPAVAAPPVAAPAPADERVTLSRAELDALLAAREAQAKQEAKGS